MQCPVCSAEMEVRHADVTENSQTGDKYERTIQNCVKDDTWVTIETPKKS